MLREWIQEKADSNVLYIDKEKRDFDFIRNYQDLNDYIDHNFVKGSHNYILIDEVGDIVEFERSVRSYRTEPDTDIVITGSNSHILSSELSTLLGGRYKEYISNRLVTASSCNSII